MKRPLIALIALLLCCSPSRPLDAAVIYESATLGPTGFVGGTGYDPSGTQFLGVRFNLASPVTTGSIGTHVNSAFSGPLFGAVVQLSSPTDFPDSADLSTPDVLGFALIFGNEEVAANLSLSLSPGDYALVFGSGQFGATGAGSFGLNDVDVVTPSYIRTTGGISWLNGGFINQRMFLDTDSVAVPEPATLLFLATTAGCLLACRWRRKRKIALPTPHF